MERHAKTSTFFHTESQLPLLTPCLLEYTPKHCPTQPPATRCSGQISGLQEAKRHRSVGRRDRQRSSGHRVGSTGAGDVGALFRKGIGRVHRSLQSGRCHFGRHGGRRKSGRNGRRGWRRCRLGRRWHGLRHGLVAATVCLVHIHVGCRGGRRNGKVRAGLPNTSTPASLPRRPGRPNVIGVFGLQRLRPSMPRVEGAAGDDMPQTEGGAWAPATRDGRRPCG